MAILYELVLAQPDQTEQLAHTRSTPTAEGFQQWNVPDLDAAKLALLDSLTSGTHFESLMPEYDVTAMASEEGPWVIRIPDSLVQRIRPTSSEQRTSLAERWGRSNAFEGWTRENVNLALDIVHERAETAQKKDKALFL